VGETSPEGRPTRRYLIVANQTLGGEQLVSKIAESMNAGPCRFYLVAPVTQTEASDRWASGGLDGGVIPGAYKIARTLAEGRLQQELARLREAGAEADGEVVDPTPRRRDPQARQPRGGRRDHRLHAAAAPVPLDDDGSATPRQARHQTARDPHQRTRRPLALSATLPAS